MKTSVVIPAWNGTELLNKSLPAVLRLNADEVIIVDDASSDGTLEYLRKNFSHVKLLVHQTNQRFPRTVNDGIAAATGDIIFLFNQDVVPTPDLIKKTLPYFKDEKSFAVTFNEEGRSWAKANYQNGFIQFSNGQLDNKVHRSFWASGGSAAFRRTMWNKLGGFDSIFSPGYYEDLDLGYRARKRGLEIIWAPELIVNHTPESSFNKAFSSTQLTKIKERNYLIVHWKNLDNQSINNHLKFLVLRVVSHPGFIIPVIWALVKIFDIVSFRAREQPFVTVSDSDLFSSFNE